MGSIPSSFLLRSKSPHSWRYRVGASADSARWGETCQVSGNLTGLPPDTLQRLMGLRHRGNRRPDTLETRKAAFTLDGRRFSRNEPIGATAADAASRQPVGDGLTPQPASSGLPPELAVRFTARRATPREQHRLVSPVSCSVVALLLGIPPVTSRYDLRWSLELASPTTSSPLAERH